MKLTNVQIKKFRSIKNVSINISEINALVGENNSGKTAVLRALNCFFNFDEEHIYFEKHRHRYAPKSNTEIILTFENIPNKDIYIDKIINNKLILMLKYEYKNNKYNFKYKTSSSKYINTDDEFIRKLKKDIDYVYIPANRSHEDLIWNRNSIFRKLLIDYSQKYTEKRDNISKQVKNVSIKLHDSILSKVENELTSLMLLDECNSYKLSFEEDIDYSIFLSKVLLKINDKGSELPITEYGSGIKSLTVIALYRELAKMQNTNIILGIEEPETNLHPQAQKKLIYFLEEKRQDYEVQAIFTTHSTVIVDGLKHEDIILIRRVPDTKRNFKSTASQIDKDFFQKYNIKEFKHYQFFDYRNSDFFFSKFVILTESKNDAQVIKYLIKPELKEKIYDISILNIEGVNNLRFPYFLLQELEIPFATVLDKDFFFSYCNSELDKSRKYETGLPIYKNSLNDLNRPIIDIMINKEKQNKIINYANTGYRKFYDILKENHVYSMNYCLEIDLLSSSKAREILYDKLNIAEQNKNRKTLLIDCKKFIKKIDIILDVLKKIPIKNYPESYKKIRNSLLEDINQIYN